MDQLNAVGFCGLVANQNIDRVADQKYGAESQHRHNPKQNDALHQPSDDEDGHGLLSRSDHGFETDD